MTILSNIVSYLADRMCEGSTRKLIAGWWYSILAATLLLTVMSFWTVSSRSFTEGFQAVWSSLIIIALAVGGTMVMRKFHSSFHTGLFIGCIVATAQYFFLLSLVYAGYVADRNLSGLSTGQDVLQSCVSMIQSFLLGSFALLLTAHRSEIIENGSVNDVDGGVIDNKSDAIDNANEDYYSL